MNDDHPLDDLLEELLPTAAAVVVAVRDRDAAAVAELVGPLDTLRLRALLVEVAAMVPTEQPLGDLLLWTHGPHVTEKTYAEIVDLVPVGFKRCSLCRDLWPLEQFHRDRSQPDGRKPRCRSCTSEEWMRRHAARDVSGSGEPLSDEHEEEVA